MSKKDQIEEQLKAVLSKAIAQEQDIRGAYDIMTGNGERWEVQITKIKE
jgi:hypothetical protein